MYNQPNQIPKTMPPAQINGLTGRPEGETITYRPISARGAHQAERNSAIRAIILARVNSSCRGVELKIVCQAQKLSQMLNENVVGSGIHEV